MVFYLAFFFIWEMHLKIYSFIQIIVLLNHRMVEVEGTYGERLVQPLLLRQGHLQTPQNQVQTALDYLPGGRLQHFSGQPEPVLGHPHRKKSLLRCSRGNLLTFSLCLLPLVISLNTTEKSLSPPSLHPLFRHFHILMRSPP